MRILTALGVGLIMGIVVAIAFGHLIVWWYARRLHSERMFVVVNPMPVLIACIVGFGVGVIWVMRD